MIMVIMGGLAESKESLVGSQELDYGYDYSHAQELEYEFDGIMA